jgi:hypothetical protein
MWEGGGGVFVFYFSNNALPHNAQNLPAPQPLDYLTTPIPTKLPKSHRK